jgi:hypothetical protein
VSGRATIDFTELDGTVEGEALEQMVRMLAQNMGLIAAYSGRGADNGKDLLVTDIEQGKLRSRPVRWLVSCKDRAKSGKSVTEVDAGSILDKVNQHNAKGFLLVTTTIPSTGLKQKLDALDIRGGGEIYTETWDSADLIRMLMRQENHDVLKAFLPESFRRLQALSPTAISLENVCDALPASVAEKVRSLADPFLTIGRLTGAAIWPHDLESQKAIDEILVALKRNDFPGSREAVLRLEYDAFMSLLGSLRENEYDLGYKFICDVIESVPDSSIALNAFQFLIGAYEVPKHQEIALASRLDEEGLEIVYGDEIRMFVSDELFQNATRYGWWSDIDVLSTQTDVDEFWIDSISLSGGDGRIEFSGTGFASLGLRFGSGDDEDNSSVSCPSRFDGYFDEHGIHIEDVSIDTSGYTFI